MHPTVARAKEAILWVEAHEELLDDVIVIIGQTARTKTSVSLFPRGEQAKAIRDLGVEFHEVEDGSYSVARWSPHLDIHLFWSQSRS